MNDCGQKVIAAVQSHVHGHQEANEDLIEKDNNSLNKMETIASEGRRGLGPEEHA